MVPNNVIISSFSIKVYLGKYIWTEMLNIYVKYIGDVKYVWTEMLNIYGQRC